MLRRKDNFPLIHGKNKQYVYNGCKERQNSKPRHSSIILEEALHGLLYVRNSSSSDKKLTMKTNFLQLILIAFCIYLFLTLQILNQQEDNLLKRYIVGEL